MITLKNDFHNTEINLKFRALKEVGDELEISENTRNKIHRVLCGSKTCTCGVVRGGDYDLLEYPNGYFICKVR